MPLEKETQVHENHPAVPGGVAVQNDLQLLSHLPITVVVVVRTGDRKAITSMECSKAYRSTMDFILNT